MTDVDAARDAGGRAGAGVEPARDAATRDERALRVAAFTTGVDTPGSRFRIRQYGAALAQRGVLVREWPSRSGAYPPTSRRARPAWAVRNLAARALDVARARDCDVTFLQREFLSTLVTLEPLTRAPRVLDVDDAIWVWGGDAFTRRLARLCDVVICGNAFLAEYFAAVHPHIELIPTVVDTDVYRPAPRASAAAPVIGWSGSQSTLPLLETIDEPLAEVLRRHRDARLRVLCDAPPRLRAVPAAQLELVPWSEERELAALQGMTVGVMPLDDSVASRGKCSLKMLLYMACGVPAVVSPVGANVAVLRAGEGSLAAASRDEWVDVLDALLRDPEHARRLGVAARAVVEREYSVTRWAGELARVLRDAAGERSG